MFCTKHVDFSARPLWEYAIKKEIEKGNNVLVVAHTNTLRGLIKHIDGIDGEKCHVIAILMVVHVSCVLFISKTSEKNIGEVSMPGGIPFVYKVSDCDQTVYCNDRRGFVLKVIYITHYLRFVV